jgi:hypothetical protein
MELRRHVNSDPGAASGKNPLYKNTTQVYGVAESSMAHSFLSFSGITRPAEVIAN